MKETIIEIIRAAIAEGADPVDYLLDYFHEKDSPRITRKECARLVERYRMEAMK